MSATAIAGKALGDRVRDRRAPILYATLSLVFAVVLFALYARGRATHADVTRALALLATFAAILVAVALVAPALARDRDTGLLRLVHSTPMDRRALLAGHVLAAATHFLLLALVVLAFAGAVAVLSGMVVVRGVALHLSGPLLAFEVFLAGVAVLASAFARSGVRATLGALSVLLVLTAALPDGPARGLFPPGSAGMAALSLNPVHGALLAASGELAWGPLVASAVAGLLFIGLALVRIATEEAQ